MADSIETGSSIPETKVLAIASHVTYGYVGNTMATFVMQTLGCEVAAINTVHYSNHLGYKQFKGVRTPASEVKDLYEGLKQSYLTDFSTLLSGYIPSAETLATVAQIARDLRYRATTKPGSFFWVLDPVMGDQGRLYVSEELVQGYKSVIREADLVLPNQFELEVLTGVKIGTEDEPAKLSDVAKAIGVLHREQGIKHVVVTSVRVLREGKSSTEKETETETNQNTLCVVGSSAKSDGSSRLFTIDVPVLDCFFSGTGDMFAALMVGRLREACSTSSTLDQPSWISPDTVPATSLPLAKATEKVLSSMSMVLEKTLVARDQEMENFGAGPGKSVGGVEGHGMPDDAGMREYLARTKAAEVRVVRNARDLVFPEQRYTAQALDM